MARSFWGQDRETGQDPEASDGLSPILGRAPLDSAIDLKQTHCVTARNK